MKDASPMAQFGDKRTYIYENKVIGESVHLGVDLASLANAPVPSGRIDTSMFNGSVFSPPDPDFTTPSNATWMRFQVDTVPGSAIPLGVGTTAMRFRRGLITAGFFFMADTDEDEIGMLTQGNMNIMNPVSEKKLILSRKYANLKPGMSVLDVGCGNGTLLSLWHKEFGISGCGIELQKESASRAKELLQGTGYSGDTSGGACIGRWQPIVGGVVVGNWAVRWNGHSVAAGQQSFILVK